MGRSEAKFHPAELLCGWYGLLQSTADCNICYITIVSHIISHVAMDMVVTETIIVLSVSFVIDNVQYKLGTKLLL